MASCIQKVLILVAMQEEAASFIKVYGLVENKSKQSPLCHIPSKVYTGTYENLSIWLVTNGRCERFKCNNVSKKLSCIIAHETSCHYTLGWNNTCCNKYICCYPCI